jgi:hypothetical protein
MQTSRSGAVPDGDQYFIIDLGVQTPVKEMVLFWDALVSHWNF